jgi:hypothetical protein
MTRRRMGKYIVPVLSLLIVGLIATSCQSGDTMTSSAPSSSVPTSKTSKAVKLADVVEYFQQQGLSTGNIISKAFQMIGAEDGFGIIVEGEQVELYLFNPNTADKETLSNLDDARRIGKFSFSGFSVPVVMNGNIMLTRYDEHPHKDKIIQVFKNFR